MTNLKEQVTHRTRRIIYSAYPATDQKKRLEAAEALGLKPRSFMRKLECNTDSRGTVSLDQSVNLARMGHICDGILSDVFAPAQMKVTKLNSQTPVAHVLTVLTKLCAEGARTMEDRVVTQEEKHVLAPLLGPAEDAFNALRLLVGESGDTKV